MGCKLLYFNAFALGVEDKERETGFWEMTVQGLPASAAPIRSFSEWDLNVAALRRTLRVLERYRRLRMLHYRESYGGNYDSLKKDDDRRTRAAELF